MQESQDSVLISIVTPSYNQGQFIEETLLSVKNQSYHNIEHIVVDGGSSDNTLEVLKKYEGVYNMRWISEPDEGQADAVNKGFKMAKGEIIGWINSDDVYFDTCAIMRVVRCFKRRLDTDVVYGDLALINTSGLILKIDVAPGFSRPRLLRGCFIPQPTTFFRRHVTQKHRLNKDLHYFMDHEFFLRISREFKFYHFRSILAAGRHYPERKTLAKKKEMFEEYEEILRKYNQTLGTVCRAMQIWDRWITGIPRRTDELVKILRLQSSYNFAFPARLDSRFTRFKRLATVNTDEIIERLVYESSHPGEERL